MSDLKEGDIVRVNELYPSEGVHGYTCRVIYINGTLYPIDAVVLSKHNRGKVYLFYEKELDKLDDDEAMVWLI